MIDILENLRDIVMKEIDEINKKGEFDENSLVCAYKLVDIVKDIDEIESHKDNGYSMEYRPSHIDWNGYGNISYARNRDSMGRYSRGYNNYRSGYSHNDERESIMAKMGHMMDTAASETERQAIQRIMNQL